MKRMADDPDYAQRRYTALGNERDLMLRPSGQSAISRVEAERTYGDLYARLVAVQEALGECGIGVRNESRFGIYRRALEKLQKIAADERLPTEERDSLLSAIRECDEFTRSVTTLMATPEIEGLRPVVARTLSGTASVALESGSTPGRDAQFELLVAARAEGRLCRKIHRARHRSRT